MKPTININGEIFETEWDDPLLIEESWTVENSKAICHFFAIDGRWTGYGGRSV